MLLNEMKNQFGNDIRFGVSKLQFDVWEVTNHFIVSCRAFESSSAADKTSFNCPSG